MRLVGRIAKAALFLVALVLSWLLLQLTHEFGHILHGWLSGATLGRITIDPLGFSYTEFHSNPHPGFVAWGGPIWGGLLPLVFFAATIRSPSWIRSLSAAFSGLCLLANGAYLAVGGPLRVADANDLLRHGSSLPVLVVAGGAMIGLGLLIWHRWLEQIRRSVQGPQSAP